LLRDRPPIPREHGAWAMLVLPLALGLAAAERVTAAAALVPPASVLLFLARFAAMGGTRARRGIRDRLPWTLLYLAASAAVLLGAVALADPAARGAAIAVAAVTGLLGGGNAALVLAGKGRGLPAEALAMAAVAATAPLIGVLSGAPLDARAGTAGGACLAYFASTVAYVRAHRALGDPARRGRAVAACTAAHAGVAIALAAVILSGAAPAGLAVAFAPVFGRTGWGLARPPRSLGALGRREIAVSAAFLVLAALALLPGPAGGR
jgi:hypothetical protein